MHCKVTGACLAMVSLVEFVWFAMVSANEDVSNRISEDIADPPMPADLLAALIQMLTFVSCDVFIIGLIFNKQKDHTAADIEVKPFATSSQ